MAVWILAAPFRYQMLPTSMWPPVGRLAACRGSVCAGRFVAICTRSTVTCWTNLNSKSPNIDTWHLESDKNRLWCCHKTIFLKVVDQFYRNIQSWWFSEAALGFSAEGPKRQEERVLPIFCALKRDTTIQSDRTGLSLTLDQTQPFI